MAMQTRRQVMCPSLPLRLGESRYSALIERGVGRRSGVCGVAGQPSAGCAQRGCGAERCRQELAV